MKANREIVMRLSAAGFPVQHLSIMLDGLLEPFRLEETIAKICFGLRIIRFNPKSAFKMRNRQIRFTFFH